MIHDPTLLDRLSAFPAIKFDGEVFRATRVGLDPLASSIAGGRWMVRDQTPTLYTSMTRDGALAEIAYHWSLLSPIPKRPVAVHRLLIRTSRTLRLARADLGSLGVDLSRYGDLHYHRTQEIGAAVAQLECDGLIAPSARWNCDNVMVFSVHLNGLDAELQSLGADDVDWIAWAKIHTTYLV